MQRAVGSENFDETLKGECNVSAFICVFLFEYFNVNFSQEYSNYWNPDDHHLESSLEEDLSGLWDMAIEPAVAEFLMENNMERVLLQLRFEEVTFFP